MKLIDKDALVAEIERISCENPMDNSWYVDTEELLNFLNTLEVVKEVQEEPVSEDLEEIAWNYADKKCHLDIAVFTPDEVKKERGKMQFTWQDLYDAVMFGAKWQKIKDESTTEDLGDYINELSKQFQEVSFAKLSRIAVRVSRWQEKQDQSTIELAEDHAYFAGSEAMREKILLEIEEAYKKGGVIETIKRIRELKK